MRLLHLDSSINGADSTSRELSQAIVDHLQAIDDCEVAYHDLVADAPPHLTRASLPWDHPVSAQAGTLDEDEKAIRNDSQKVLNEFLDADIVVVGVPMYNFTAPTQLKAWIDRIIVPGKTFHFGANGPEGLAGDKRIILTVVRGSSYGPQTEMAAFEHAETYLRAIFAFIGQPDVEVVVAEGIASGGARKAQAIAKARDAIARLDAPGRIGLHRWRLHLAGLERIAARLH